MTNSQPRLALARSGKLRLDILPRDPDRAYVYWEWPGGDDEITSGRLTVYVDDPSGERRAIDSFEVDSERSGRFVDFAQPGAVHRCQLVWGDESVDSKPLRAPRSESGNGSPAFVRVRLSDDGLVVEPADHEHPAHGHFPAAHSGAPSSHRFDS